MKKNLLIFFGTAFLLSITTRFVLYLQGNSPSTWATTYDIADSDDVSEFLEKKKRKNNKKKQFPTFIPIVGGSLQSETLSTLGAAAGYSNHDKDDQYHSQISNSAYGQMAQQIEETNPYQASAYYFTAAIFNVLEQMHHAAEINRHGYDPFLDQDSNGYGFSKDGTQSGQNYYGAQYKQYVQQAFSVLQNTDALETFDECMGDIYYVKPKNGCQSNCDCTGNSYCSNNQCVGNSDQLMNFKQAQDIYLAKMYEQYFCNIVQKVKLDVYIANYITQNYEEGKDYDQQALIETQITLFEILYQIQQIATNPKQHTGNSNQFVKFSKNAFQWIANQANEGIKQSIIEHWADGDDDLKDMLNDLDDIDGDVSDFLNLVKDPTNIFNWIDAINDYLGDDADFADMKDITDAFKDASDFTIDDIGDFSSFGDLFSDILPDVAFDAGAMIADVVASTVAVGGDAIGTAIACLLILCGC